MVIEGVEDILESYPKYPYQVAFSIAEFRNKLILDVANQLPNYYTILEEQKELPTHSGFLYSSVEEQERLERLIRNTIVDIVQEDFDSISHLIPQKEASESKVSHESVDFK